MRGNLETRHFILATFLTGATFCFFVHASEKATDVDQGTIYSPVGKRDPFKVPSLAVLQNRDLASLIPLEQYSVEQLELKGILKESGAKARAMFEDPAGETFILTEGDRLGKEKATISRILNTEVIVTEKTFNYLGVESLYEKVISLPQK